MKQKTFNNLLVLMCLLAFTLFIVGGLQPLWEGKQIVETTAQPSNSKLIVDFPGGSEFAFNQKSKSGDIPRVLPISLDNTEGSFALVIKDFGFMYDTRWVPNIMAHDGHNFTYVQYRKPRQYTRAKERTHHFADIPGIGNFQLYEYDLHPNEQYFLLLPQNNLWRGKPYSVEIRQRKKRESDGFLILLGGISLLGIFILRINEKNLLTMKN